MKASEALKDELRAVVKVSQVAEALGVKLTRSGHEFKALSPFNQENSPSFTVNDAKGLFACFSSGKSGDVFDLQMEITGCNFPDAVARIAEMAGIDVPGKQPGQKHGRTTKMDDAMRREPERAPFDDDIGHLGSNEPPPPKKAPVKREIVKTYDYLDGDGALAYQVVRYEPKGFSQRRPAPGEPGKWVWGLSAGQYVRKRGGDWLMGGGDRTEAKGFVEAKSFPAVEHGVYRLPKLLEELANPANERDVIFLPEGEKDVETLEGWGLLGTTNSGGAKNWRPDHAELFRECDVVILLDGDKPGRERGELVAKTLHNVAHRIRILELPGVEDAHGLVRKGSDVSDWKAAGHSKDDLLKIVAKLPSWSPDAPSDFKSKFGAIPMANLFDEAEEYGWLIKGLVPRRERMLVYGEPQSGKSFMSLDIALAIARGENFRDLKTSQAGVVYCAFEGGKGFRNRVKGYFLGHDVVPDPAIPFVILTRDADLFGSEDVVKDMVDEIKHWASTFSVPVGLIVFDTISACTPGMNENAGEEIGRFLGHARHIGAETGATIMLVHHKPKQGDTPRGSGKLTGDLETTIEVGFPGDGVADENDRPIRVLKVKKQREGEAGKEFRFVLRKIEVGKDSDGDAITTCLVEKPGGAERPKDAQGFLLRSANEHKFFQALWKAQAELGEDPPPGFVGVDGKPPLPGIKIVRISHVKRAFLALDVGPEDDTEDKAIERMEKAVKREHEKFLRLSLIGMMKPFFWWSGKPIRGVKETFTIGGGLPQTYRDDDGHEASTVIDPFEGEDPSAPF